MPSRSRFSSLRSAACCNFNLPPEVAANSPQAAGTRAIPAYNAIAVAAQRRGFRSRQSALPAIWVRFAKMMTTKTYRTIALFRCLVPVIEVGAITMSTNVSAGVFSTHIVLPDATPGRMKRPAKSAGPRTDDTNPQLGSKDRLAASLQNRSGSPKMQALLK